MSYSPQTWNNGSGGGTPLSAARLTVMETGIEDADTRITAVESGKLDTSAAPELIRDTMATALVAGSNVTITPNDGADTITIAATGGGGGSVNSVTAANATITIAGTGADPTVAVGSIAASATTSGTFSSARLPLVPNPPVTLTYGASLTPDASAGNLRECTMTGDATLNAPTNPTTGQVLALDFLASAATRTLTIDSGITRFAGINSAIVIDSGKIVRLVVYRSGLLSAWVVVAKGGT